MSNDFKGKKSVSGMSVAFDNHNFNYVNLESFDLYNVKEVKFRHQLAA